jgi:hypothetical protein
MTPCFVTNTLVNHSGSSYKAVSAYQAGYDALEGYLPEALRRLEAQRKGLVS